MKFGWGYAFFLHLLLLAFVVPTAGAQSLCVTHGGAGLRRSPSSKAPVTWKVPKYMPLQGTGKRQSGGWIEVRDLDGQTHWVPSREVTTAWSCVVVRTRSTRLRMGPGKQFQPSPLGLADKYAAFLDLGGEDGWVQIENDEGEKGWANMDHLWKPARKTRMSFDGN